MNMKKLLSGSNMKPVDKYSIEYIGIPSAVLMERAAFGVYKNIERMLKNESRVLVICGVGNNGADGIALARILMTSDFNINADVFVVGDEGKATEEFKQQSDILFNRLHGNKINMPASEDKYDIIIDAVFGIGLKRNVEGEYAKLIQNVNKRRENDNSYVVSVDVPSGINADTGEVMGTAVFADMTVTFGTKKTGIVLYPGTEYAGKVFVENIGFPKEAFEQNFPEDFYFTESDLTKVPSRKSHTNKGSYGKVLVVAGSKGIYGAAYLSAKSVFRSGAGMVKIITAKENREALNKMLPEAMIETYGISDFNIENYRRQLDWADVIIVGPGIGMGDYQKDLVKEALKTKKPIVIDADALNTISSDKKLCDFYHEKCVVTPHMMEMSRLINGSIDKIKGKLPEIAGTYAKENGIVCVLKDARTIVADKSEKRYYNMSGNDGMATAGSGDVLTGVIAGLMAQGLDVFT